MGSRLSRYRIDALLGRGGMGDVHRAFDTLLRRDVAIKVLHTGTGHAGEQARARLLREARLGAALAHPNVVTIHDLGEDDDGDAFIVMELALGQTLRQIMQSRAVHAPVKMQWLADIASALEAAHDAGLVHRDIKPDNVMVGPNGVVKVLDFGIAKRQGADPTSGPIPASPPSLGIAGTPAYMAPEQWRGEVDERSDQYAWGILAYELLTGHRPVVVVDGKPTQRAALRSMTEHGVPSEMDIIVARATAPNASDRFPTMRTLRAAWPKASDPMLDGAPATHLDARRRERESAPTLPTTPGSTLVMPSAPTLREEDHLATIESASLSHPANGLRLSSSAPRRWWIGIVAGVASVGAVASWIAATRATPAPAVTKVEEQPVPKAARPPFLALAGEQALVRVGLTQTCALMPDRTLRCWGGGRAAPAPVEGLAGVFEFSLGTTHGCAVTSSETNGATGEVYCWGGNDQGQLGDGTTRPSVTAKKVPLPIRAVFVASSSTHTCALGERETPDVYCWGGNEMGQLGDGTVLPSLVPKKVAFADGDKILRLVVGHQLSCALSRAENKLWCWGRNDVGQAGQDPTRPSVTRPTVVSGLPTVNGIFPGMRHVCARDATSREVWCWGANDRGQLGLGKASPWERPTHVPGVQAIDTMRAGADFSCALLIHPGRPARGLCWGSNDYGQLGIEPVGKDQPSAVESDVIKEGFDAKMANHVCKVDATTGAVWCWGRNDEQQLGDGTGRSTVTPVRVHD